jgi:hypothetical protein
MAKHDRQSRLFLRLALLAKDGKCMDLGLSAVTSGDFAFAGGPAPQQNSGT